MADVEGQNYGDEKDRKGCCSRFLSSICGWKSDNEDRQTLQKHEAPSASQSEHSALLPAQNDQNVIAVSLETEPVASDPKIRYQQEQLHTENESIGRRQSQDSPSKINSAKNCIREHPKDVSKTVNDGILDSSRDTMKDQTKMHHSIEAANNQSRSPDQQVSAPLHTEHRSTVPKSPSKTYSAEIFDGGSRKVQQIDKSEIVNGSSMETTQLIINDQRTTPKTGNLKVTNGKGDLSHGNIDAKDDRSSDKTVKERKLKTVTPIVGSLVVDLQAPVIESTPDQQTLSGVPDFKDPIPPVVDTCPTLPESALELTKKQQKNSQDEIQSGEGDSGIQNRELVDKDLASHHEDLQRPVDVQQNTSSPIDEGAIHNPLEDKLQVEEAVWRFTSEFHRKVLDDICGAAVHLCYNYQSGCLHIRSSGMQPVGNVSDKIVSLCQRISDEVDCKPSSCTQNIKDKSVNNDVKQVLKNSRCILFSNTSTGDFQIVGPRNCLEMVESEILTLLQRFKFRTLGGINVEVLRNNLVHECVDAIVNPANSNLQHGGGAARVIADAAGDELNSECAEYIKQHKKLRCTEVMHTTAGKMNPRIRYVLHVAGPRSTDFPDKDDLFKALLDTFYNCMCYADTRLEIKELSIPAIGSGIFGCPKELVAEAAYEALMKFDGESRGRSVGRTVDTVRFVNVDSETTNIFIAKFTELHQASCNASLHLHSDKVFPDEKISSDDEVTSAARTERDDVECQAADLSTDMDCSTVESNADLSCDSNPADSASSGFDKHQSVTNEEENLHTGNNSYPLNNIPEHADVHNQGGSGDKLEDADMEIDVPKMNVHMEDVAAAGDFNPINIASDCNAAEHAKSPYIHNQGGSDDKLEDVNMENIPKSNLCMENTSKVTEVPVIPPYLSDQLNFTTASGIAVQIYRQNLLSEKVDAIVCSVDVNLDLGGGAASAIASAAGTDLQRTCEDYKKTRGSLTVTNVMHSEAGKLRPSIKYVILAAGPSAGMFTIDRQLLAAVAETFFNCMQYANDELKVNSISLPAISSGAYGVSKDVVARAAWEALSRFDQLHQGGATCTLKTVRFVNIDMESTQVFVSIFYQLWQSGVPRQPTGPGTGSPIPSIADNALYFTSNCQIDVEVYSGDLLSERTAAIVCSVDSRLDLSGGAARAISRAAGNSFEQECKDYVSRCGHLHVTEVRHASSGQLHPHIQYLMLAVGPTQGQYKDVKHFYMALIDTFYNCLLYANDTLKISSVSIPAISSGNIGASKELVASAAYEALLTFDGKVLRGMPRNLESLHFVNIDPGTTAAFVSTFKERRHGKLSVLGDTSLSSGGHSAELQSGIHSKRVRQLKKTTDVQVESEVKPPSLVVSSRQQQPVGHVKCVTACCGINVEVYCANLLLEQVDAIVCSVNSRLDLGGGVAKLMSKAAGSGMIQDCDDFIRSNGSIAVTKVTHVSAGGLAPSIGHVILVVGPALDMYQDLSSFQTALVETFYNCLQYANSSMKITSIALPAISAGNLGAPKEVVANAALEALVKFDNSLQDGTTQRHIQCVRFVNIDPSTTDAFVNAFKHGKLSSATAAASWVATEPVPQPGDVSGPQDSIPVAIKWKRQLKDNAMSADAATVESIGIVMSTDEDELSSEPVEVKKLKDVSYDAAISTAVASPTDDDKNDDCVICMDKISDPKQLACGHKFCADCIDQYFSRCQHKCPSCGRLYGVMKGNQPPGTMDVKILPKSLAGFEAFSTIRIEYDIPDGIQTDEHPNPGVQYYGTQRSGLLPNSAEGQEVCELLKRAFDARLIFTVGRSITTGADNMVIWNDIHHKTGFTGQYGYPDPSYLSRVKTELAAKGITP